MMQSSIIPFCIIYILYIILPLFPAILIYKIFPDTKVAINGPLQGLTIKTTGAFAGYIICCLIGYPIISQASMAARTEQQQNCAWQVNAKIDLLQPDNKTLIEDEDFAKCMQNFTPTIDPPIIRHKNNCITLYLPESMMKDATISFGIAGFASKTINSDELSKMQKDDIKKVLNLGTISLRQFKTKDVDAYNRTALTATPVRSLPIAAQ